MEVEEIKNLLKNHEERLEKIESLLFKNEQSTVASPVSKKISINEFTSEKKPSDDLQRTVIFAYFLEKHEGQEYFNAVTIQNCFLRSKHKIPANINDKINQCIKKGWISEHPQKKDDKKVFYITNKGVAAVENNFQQEKE